MARTQVRSTRRISHSFGSDDVRPSQIRTVRDSGSAYSLLHPIRRRILELLHEPDSASGLARRLRMPRQVLNYHVKEMARARLLRPAGRRKRRALFEQCYVASALGYVMSPEILGALSLDSGAARDRFSATFLMGMANQIQSEVGYAMERAETLGKRVTTLGMSSEIRFRSAEQRAEFARALDTAVLAVIERYASPFRDGGREPRNGRAYRLVLGCYPISELGMR
jgi:DNA-binding transcriptional ArsR family regulator